MAGLARVRGEDGDLAAAAFDFLLAGLFLAGCSSQVKSLQTTKHDPIWTTQSDDYGCRAYPETAGDNPSCTRITSQIY